MLTAELKQRLVNKVKEVTEKANKIYGIDMPVPAIRMDKKGTVAGTAHYREHMVNFNTDLYIRNVEEFLADTAVHEVAHLVTGRLHGHDRRWTGRKWVRGVQPHGIEWQNIMRSLGAEPIRCHSFDTTETKIKRNVTKYQYTCGCKTYEVGAKVHKRIQMGAVYTCRKCKGKLTAGNFVSKNVPNTVETMPKVTEPATKVPKTGSKKERAEALYMQYKHDRGLTISMFMQELAMSKAGASTYFYNCQKKLG